MKMTAASLLFVSTFISFAAHADVEIKSASQPRVLYAAPGHNAARDLKACPVLTKVVITTPANSLEAVSIRLEAGKQVVEMRATAPTKTCQSDIVCPTSDNFVLDAEAYASATRNNDGNYPTTDLPGHNSVALTGKTLSGHSVTCEYNLL